MLVVVVKSHHEDLRRWMWYHTLLGIRHFVIICNECNLQDHRSLLAAASAAPCAPRVQFIHEYRCAFDFIAEGYEEAVRLLLRDDASNETRVGFWDTDEYLVVGGRPLAQPEHRKPEQPAIDVLLDTPGFEPMDMWTFSPTVFGSSLRTDEPASGFIPANYILTGASDYIARANGGGLFKSACRLDHLRQGLGAGQPLFRGPFPCQEEPFIRQLCAFVYVEIGAA